MFFRPARLVQLAVDWLGKAFILWLQCAKWQHVGSVFHSTGFSRKDAFDEKQLLSLADKNRAISPPSVQYPTRGVVFRPQFLEIPQLLFSSLFKSSRVPPPCPRKAFFNSLFFVGFSQSPAEMSGEDLLEAVRNNNLSEVQRLVGENKSIINSTDSVSVCSCSGVTLCGG